MVQTTISRKSITNPRGLIPHIDSSTGRRLSTPGGSYWKSSLVLEVEVVTPESLSGVTTVDTVVPSMEDDP